MIENSGASTASNNDVILGVFIILCATGLWSFCIGGYMTNPLDIAPDFAGVVLGFSNTLGAISGFLGAEVMGAFTSAFPENGAGWRYLFCLGAGLAFVAAVVYVLGADAAVQPWAVRKEEGKEEEVKERMDMMLKEVNKETGIVVDGRKKNLAGKNTSV